MWTMYSDLFFTRLDTIARGFGIVLMTDVGKENYVYPFTQKLKDIFGVNTVFFIERVGRAYQYPAVHALSEESTLAEVEDSLYQLHNTNDRFVGLMYPNVTKVFQLPQDIPYNLLWDGNNNTSAHFSKEHFTDLMRWLLIANLTGKHPEFADYNTVNHWNHRAPQALQMDPRKVYRIHVDEKMDMEDVKNQRVWIKEYWRGEQKLSFVQIWHVAFSQ